MSVCVGLIMYGPYWLFSFLHMCRCYNADTADFTLWPPNPYDPFLLISSSSLHLCSAKGYFQQLEYKTALRDLQISHWSCDYASVSLHPHPGHSSWNGMGCSSAVPVSGKGSPLPVHVFRKPDAGHWCHQLLQEHLLTLIVLELVANENQRFHEGTLLHLCQEQLIGEELLHMVIKHVKIGLQINRKRKTEVVKSDFQSEVVTHGRWKEDQGIPGRSGL